MLERFLADYFLFWDPCCLAGAIPVCWWGYIRHTPPKTNGWNAKKLLQKVASEPASPFSPGGICRGSSRYLCIRKMLASTIHHWTPRHRGSGMRRWDWCGLVFLPRTWYFCCPQIFRWQFGRFGGDFCPNPKHVMSSCWWLLGGYLKIFQSGQTGQKSLSGKFGGTWRNTFFCTKCCWCSIYFAILLCIIDKVLVHISSGAWKQKWCIGKSMKIPSTSTVKRSPNVPNKMPVWHLPNRALQM